MAMIGNCADITVDIWVEMAAALPMVNTTRNHMPQMRNHACRDEQLPLRIIIESPGVAEAVSHNLEAILRRMISPNTAIDVSCLSIELDVVRKRIAMCVESPSA